MKRFLLVVLIIVAVMPLSAQVAQPIVENWENGDFASLSWERPDLQYRWEVTSEGAHSG